MITGDENIDKTVKRLHALQLRDKKKAREDNYNG